jgi:hypothetical protein
LAVINIDCDLPKFINAMDSGQNYQRLTDEEQRGSNVNSTESTTAPPVLDSAGVLNISPTTMAANQNNLTAEPANNLVEPPSYNIAVDLPTYEEMSKLNSKKMKRLPNAALVKALS